MSESGPPVWDATGTGDSGGPVAEPAPVLAEAVSTAAVSAAAVSAAAVSAAAVSTAAGSATPGVVPASAPPTVPVAPVSTAPVVPLPTAPVAPVVRSGTTNRVSGGTLALVLASVVAVGGLAFAVGRMTAPATSTGRGGSGFPSASGQPFPSGGLLPGGLFGGGTGGVTISGTVTAVRDGELTIKTSSGTEVTIPVDDTTAYHSQAAASASDVTSGTSVKVQVTADRGRGPQSSPGALASPGAGGPGGQVTFGTATDVTIVGD